MRNFIAFILVVVLATGFSLWRWGFQPVPQRKVAGHVALWQQTIAREIPIGTDRKKILEWAEVNDIALYKFNYTDLYGLIETLVPEGINFPCSRYNIIIEIRMDKEKKSKSQKIRASDGCQ